MERSGVAFVSMVAATVSAAALSYSVFWVYQGEGVAGRDAPVVQAPAVVPPAPKPPAREALSPAVMAPPPAVAPPTEPVPVANAAKAPLAPQPTPLTPPVKSALAKPQPPAPETKASAPEPVAAEAPPPRPAAVRASAAAEPVNPTPNPEPREPARADAPTALHPAEPARETNGAAPTPVAPAAKAEFPPRGPFAALPPAPEAPTADAPAAGAPAAGAPNADRTTVRISRPPRTILRHAPLPRVAALPPFVPPSRPEVHRAHPIAILRGGPFIHAAQTGTQSVAAALAPPPPGIRIMRGTRPHPVDRPGLGPVVGPPGPLILRVQN